MKTSRYIQFATAAKKAAYRFRSLFSTSAAPAKPAAASGTTLLELLITLLIIAILLGVSSPTWYQLVQQSRADSAQQQLRKAIYRTRSAAIYSKKIVSLCPYGATACNRDWNLGAMIFTDKNNNGIIDDNDRLLEKIDWNIRNFKLSWRASARKNHLRYSPTGMARAFGRFTLCEDSGDLSLARTIVVNRQGRLRQYRDRNSDGIVEDIDGRQPDCSG